MPADGPAGPVPVFVISVDTAPGMVEALVGVSGPHAMRTTGYPDVDSRALAILPGLRRHECDSGSARGIVAEIADTETPHLLEHIALELLALAGWPRSIRGRTRWDFATDGRGVYRVSIRGVEASSAEAALRAAARVVEYLLGQGERPDIDSLVRGLGSD